MASLPSAKVGDDVSVTLRFTASGDAGGVVDDSDTAVLTIRDAEAGDAIAPAPVLSAVPGTHGGSSGPVTVTVDFGEAVTGFVVGDVTVSGGTTSNFSGAAGASRYTLTVTPDGNAALTVSVAADVAADLGGNANTAAADLTVNYGAAPAPQAFSWQATLEVNHSSSWYGYCGSPCPVSGPGTHGTLEDDGGAAGFRVPGLDAEVEVTAIHRDTSVAGGKRLLLGLSTSVAADVYGTWTLDWDGVKQVALSSRSDVTGAGVLIFENFFSGIYSIDDEDEVQVCITGHGGVSTCTAPDATLSALAVSETDGTAVTLDPVFAAATTAYTATVANDVETVTVTATATDDNAAVAFDPAEDADTTTEGHQVALDVGANTITATVTIRGQTEAYTVTVTRADTTLSDLSLTDGGGNAVTLDPVFASGTTSYTATVANDVDTVTVAATATAADAGATVAFDPAEDADTDTAGHQVTLAEGENKITATVTHGSLTGAYNVTVTREEAAAGTALLWSATMMVSFNSSWWGYCGAPCPSESGSSAYGTLADKGDDGDVSADSFTVPGETTPVEVTVLERYSSFDGNQLIVGLSPLPDVTVYGEWTLNWGDLAEVKLSDRSRVTSANLLEFDTFFSGISRSNSGDTVTVTLSAEGGDGGMPDTTDTTLSALTLADGSGTDVTLDPVFAADTTAYTVTVANDVTTVTVAATATAEAAGATVAFDPADADTDAEGHQVTLAEGANVVTATVTHGTETRAYTVTVTRAMADAPALFWSAELMVAATTKTRHGFGFGKGEVTSDTFDAPGDVETRVAYLDWQTTGSDVGTVNFSTFPALPEGYTSWTLHVDGDRIPLTGASATPVPLPAGAQYTVSGDNFAGTPPTTGTVRVCFTAAARPAWCRTRR